MSKTQPTNEEHEAIQIDKERWMAAYKMLQNSRYKIDEWLETLSVDDCEDYRRRLNTIQHNRKAGRLR